MWESYRAVEAGLGREENFLSLEDVLMSQEKLPCRLESGLARLGFLDKGGDTEHIPEVTQGSKMELPLWLVKGLYDNKRRIVSVELPKIYREGWRTVFSADANVVDLHKMGPHYYSFGSQLLNFDSQRTQRSHRRCYRLSSGASVASWTPPRTPTMRTPLGWWPNWMNLSVCYFGLDRGVSTLFRTGKGGRRLRSQPPAWCKVTRRESSMRQIHDASPEPALPVHHLDLL
ncbi:unnamed protein product [Staurois parvus]|uniref:DNA replication complex GINS protein PSF3 n=1 Tax=Staurois parvus TaxID=386267 RepID=A0ABN9H5H4_9NEOB|nr:unnamed protein product [Staurois parvus]